MGHSLTDIHELVALDLTNPGANADCFATPLTAKGKIPIVRVSVVLNTDSVVNVREILASASVDNVYGINANTAITADNLQSFDITAVSGATYNVQFETSQTGSGGVVKRVHLQQFEG